MDVLLYLLYRRRLPSARSPAAALLHCGVHCVSPLNMSAGMSLAFVYSSSFKGKNCAPQRAQVFRALRSIFSTTIMRPTPPKIKVALVGFFCPSRVCPVPEFCGGRHS